MKTISMLEPMLQERLDVPILRQDLHYVVPGYWTVSRFFSSMRVRVKNNLIRIDDIPF